MIAQQGKKIKMPKIAILENTKIVWNALINDFAKTNKMRERKIPESKMAESHLLSTKEIAPQEHLKQKD